MVRHNINESENGAVLLQTQAERGHPNCCHNLPEDRYMKCEDRVLDNIQVRRASESNAGKILRNSHEAQV